MRALDQRLEATGHQFHQGRRCGLVLWVAQLVVGDLELDGCR
jgi:hypothetical protein